MIYPIQLHALLAVSSRMQLAGKVAFHWTNTVTQQITKKYQQNQLPNDESSTLNKNLTIHDTEKFVSPEAPTLLFWCFSNTQRNLVTAWFRCGACLDKCKNSKFKLIGDAQISLPILAPVFVQKQGENGKSTFNSRCKSFSIKRAIVLLNIREHCFTEE